MTSNDETHKLRSKFLKFLNSSPIFGSQLYLSYKTAAYSLQRDYRWGPLLTKEYPIKYSLQWFFTEPLSWEFWQIFSTDNYTGVGIKCRV